MIFVFSHIPPRDPRTVKAPNNDTYLEAIELPSPTNRIQDRYLAAIQLFVRAIYKSDRGYNRINGIKLNI